MSMTNLPQAVEKQGTSIKYIEVNLVLTIQFPNRIYKATKIWVAIIKTFRCYNGTTSIDCYCIGTKKHPFTSPILCVCPFLVSLTQGLYYKSIPKEDTGSVPI